MEIALVLFLLVAAIILFSLEKISVDIITGIMLVILIASGILDSSEAFAGFSSDFIVILASVFVITAAIHESGILESSSSRLLKYAGSSYYPLLFFIMLITAVISAFMNNTTATALLISPILGIAKKSGVSASRLLIPLAYASIAGGTCTLIGTSTNVAVSGFIARTGMEPLGMFEMLPAGLILFSVSLLYLMLGSKWLLPDNKEKELTESYGIREYLSEVVIMKDSPLINQFVFQSDLAGMGFNILMIVRRNVKFLPGSNSTLEAGDILLVEGKIENLLKIRETHGVEIRGGHDQIL